MTADAGFLDRLSPAERTAVERLAERRRYRAGEVLCHKGEVGRACLIIQSGGVVVEVGPAGVGRARRVFLGPGQIVGEMSLLSASPVTATVLAAVETEAYVIPRPVFLDLVDRAPGFRDALFDLLVGRMRDRESRAAEADGAPLTVIVVPRGSPLSDRLLDRLSRGVEYYAPGSVFVDTRADGAGQVQATARREGSLGRPGEAAPGAGEGAATHVVTSGDLPWCAQMIETWRVGGGMGRALCLVLVETVPPEITARLRHGDLVLVLHAPDAASTIPHEGLALGLAAVDHVGLAGSPGPGPDEPWMFQVPKREFEGECPPFPDWRDPPGLGTIDWLARRVTGREVGLVLGAGAAAGFAHLGVMLTLEEAGIAVDYVCGSSMGGVVALLTSKTGSVSAATEMCREMIGSNDKLRDLTFWPRSGLIKGQRRREVISRAMGETTFAELTRPSAVVAADLVRGERFVFEKGLARVATMATSAIPGIFPPEEHAGRILVDGAIVSRIPADLLERRRCGLKIAVNVVPSTAHGQQGAQRLQRSFARFFGFANVIASSWGLLAWWHGAAEARQADILVEPRPAPYSGYDFGTIEEKIQAGRIATLEKLDTIQDAVSHLLRPGAS